MAARKHKDKTGEAPRPEIVRIVAENIEALMTRHDYANKRLSEATKGQVGEGTVARMRNGTVAVGIDNLAAIAKVFGLAPWQLLVEDLNPSHPPQLAFPSAAERELYERFRQFIESSR